MIESVSSISTLLRNLSCNNSTRVIYSLNITVQIIKVQQTQEILLLLKGMKLFMMNKMGSIVAYRSTKVLNKDMTKSTKRISQSIEKRGLHYRMWGTKAYSNLIIRISKNSMIICMDKSLIVFHLSLQSVCFLWDSLTHFSN